ncbi:uncharacterized protein LOC114537622 [Dendronephthya gigantea]|uniref:uncharacterized protein LOC114537622 n=1 Tax=Dendronephthya gigantea TaxID=151771 RepID=UPI00106BB186|nr:uncharacterized protein LOC114537622 [Dendronephthya gigantea]
MLGNKLSRIYIIISTGLLTLLVIKWQLLKTVKINTLLEKPMSLLSNEKYDTGRMLTQKITCFVCEDKDYGKKWKFLTEDGQCQNEMFELCFRNLTKYRRRSLKIASIVRRCQLDDCECDNQPSHDWCVTSHCSVKFVCCEEQYLRCSRIYNYWLYTYFRTNTLNYS